MVAAGGAGAARRRASGGAREPRRGPRRRADARAVGGRRTRRRAGAAPAERVSGRVRIGCSGWNYKHWREVVYPPGLPARRWLEHYATRFETVELNTTFYRLPSVAAVASWVGGT